MVLLSIRKVCALSLYMSIWPSQTLTLRSFAMRPKHHHRKGAQSTDAKGKSKLLSSVVDHKSDLVTYDKPRMTFLAGFLGSGKTSALQHILVNNDGIKIGVIVNDVAAINIDNKLLSNPNVSSEESIELQNGCACCSLAEELLTSIEVLTDGGRKQFDAIVIELTGVADPKEIKKNWEQARTMGHAATKLAEFNKVVTLVDSSTFGTDWMTWDISIDRDGWVQPDSSHGADKMVSELLAEQIEAADVLIINKIDLAGEEQVQIASELAKSLNNDAEVFMTNFGEVPVEDIIRNTVPPTLMSEGKIDPSDTPFSNGADNHSHSHSHHDHDREAESHVHDEENASSKKSNGSDHSHSHSHSHSHNHPIERDYNHLGITNFVYTAKRPFVPARLLNLLSKWPIPIKEKLDFQHVTSPTDEGVDNEDFNTESPFVGVLRSKGFCWMCPTQWSGSNADVWRHSTAMYWSHAGKQFGISTAGQWWGTLSKDQMKEYFINNVKEFNRIIEEDFVTEEFGDRRQEIVFIGAVREEEIVSALDGCLCNDKEMEIYRDELLNSKALL